MTIADIHRHKLSYDGDNGCFMVNQIIPNLILSDYDKQVLRWSYGYDEEAKSYELDSDGETFVKDLFFGGKIKSPNGVGHDYLNRVPGHTTPDGKEWTRQETNNFYKRVSKAIGYPWFVRNRRWFYLTLSRSWWRKVEDSK